MPKVLMLSRDEVFKNDLVSQIKYHAPEFVICEESDYPDVVVIDDNGAVAEEWKDKKIPLIYLNSKEIDFALPDGQVLNKPINLMAFLDALKSANRLFENSQSGCLEFGSYILYPSKKEIVDVLTNKVCKLTEKEVAIIKYLYKNAGSYVAKQDLLKEVWEYADDATTHTVETHIYRLRQKVEDGKDQIIETSEGGYRLSV